MSDQTGRRHLLLRDLHPPSGSSFTVGEHLTIPFSPPLPRLLSPTLPPSTLTPPRTSLLLKHPDRGLTVLLWRDRMYQRAARTVAATKLRPRITDIPSQWPIRIHPRCSSILTVTLHPLRQDYPLLWLRPVPCSPGGPSDQWLCPRKRST